MTKTKVFLYAFSNQIGAFDLSARYLAEQLDKTEFEIYTLNMHNGPLEKLSLKGVHTFNCFYPAKVSNMLGIIWGVFHADVVFVLRGNHFKFVSLLLRFFKRKSFKRQGNKIDDEVVESIAKAVGGKQNIAASYNFCDKVYSPTKLIGEYNNEKWGIKYDKEIFLPPFINTSSFSPKQNLSKRVENIVFIGNDMLRKNIGFYIDLARQFEGLNFHVVGKEPKEDFFAEAPKNLSYHGLKKPLELNAFLDNMDLHCFPSRSEGFGKVTIEVASKGIPSILFDDYGAKEWMKNGDEGIVVGSEEDFIIAVRRVATDETLFSQLQNGALTLAKRFDTEVQVNRYANIVQNLRHE